MKIFFVKLNLTNSGAHEYIVDYVVRAENFENLLIKLDKKQVERNTIIQILEMKEDVVRLNA